MPKVTGLIDKAWHSGGKILKGQTVEVSKEDAEILVNAGHVKLAADKVPAKSSKAD